MKVNNVVEDIIMEHDKIQNILFKYTSDHGYNKLVKNWKRQIKVYPDYPVSQMLSDLLNEIDHPN